MKVSDSGPLIVFYNASLLHLLKSLYDTIIVPKAVFNEITVKEEGKKLFLENKWIKVYSIKNKQMAETLKFLIDPGESEAITLSIELKIPLLIDDRAGRTIAKSMNIRFQGVLGTLLKLKKKGILKSVKEAIVRIIEAGYYIDYELIKTILKWANEEPF